MLSYDFYKPAYKSPPPILTGAIEELLSERMNADFAQANQTASFAHYRRVTLGDLFLHQSIIQIPDDYYYHLDGIRVFYPLTAQGDESPTVNFELYQISRSREMSPVPIPWQLVTTPAFQQRARYRVNTNHTFLPADKIQIDVRATNGTDPTHIDIMTEGIRIPKNFIIQE